MENYRYDLQECTGLVLLRPVVCVYRHAYSGRQLSFHRFGACAHPGHVHQSHLPLDQAAEKRAGFLYAW